MTDRIPETPPEGLREILARARRRATKVHGGTALAAWAGFSLLSILAAAWGIASGLGGWPRTMAWVAILVAGGVALARTWRKALSPDDHELARTLEARIPGAGGLVSSLEISGRLRDPSFPYSRELARAHVEETASRALTLRVEGAFDARPLRIASRGALGAAALFLGAAALWPSAIAKVFVSSPRKEAVARRASPITGDVSLTYLYPAYTGLPPRTVEGTAGEISALRGTEVRIETRADREVERAFIELGEAALPLEVEGGRILRGALGIQDAGQYSFRFEGSRGKVLTKGPPISIAVVEDAAPSISIEAPVAELVVTERDAVEVRYEASDDFGLSQVELVYQVGSTGEERIAIAGEGGKRLSGTTTWELAPLRLRPGETVTWYLRARDNDAVSGPKWGQSRTQTLKVYSQAEHRRELLAKAEEAWERMILGLGDRIEPREGPRRVEGEARVEAGRRADGEVLAAVGLLQDVAAAFAKDEAAPPELFAAIQNLARNLGKKAHHTRATRARSAGVAQGREAYLRQLDQVEAEEQEELERGVLYLESLLDRQRLFEIEELSRELAESRKELANLLETYQGAPSDEAKREILRELGRLRQRIGDLLQRMAQLGSGIQDEHLNLEAQKALGKERDLLGALEDVEKKVEAGDLDGALAELQKLAMQMEQLTQALGEAVDGQVESDPALQKLAEDLQAFDEELAALEEGQKELARMTEKAREEQSRHLQEQLASQGRDLVADLLEKARRAREHFGGLPEHRLPRASSDDLLATWERLEDLQNSLHARDFDASLESAAASLAYAMSLELGLGREKSYAERFGIGSVDELDTWLRRAERGVPLVREVKETLEKMFSDPSRQLTEGQKQRLQDLARKQQSLGERMQALREQAEEIGSQAPIFDDGSMGKMDEARQSMHEAAERLRGRQPGQALASERRAQEHLDSLRQGLEQAKQQARSQGGGGGFPLPMGGSGRRGGDGKGFDGKEKVKIPDADPHQGSEAYRKEILDAMKKQAPEEFEEPVRDYYEEIVK